MVSPGYLLTQLLKSPLSSSTAHLLLRARVILVSAAVGQFERTVFKEFFSSLWFPLLSGFPLTSSAAPISELCITPIRPLFPAGVLFLPCPAHNDLENALRENAR